MLAQAEMARKFRSVFDRRQSEVLAEVVTKAYSDLVKTGDFNELKEIVRDLAVAQQRTESRMEELASAQQRTESRMEELASAQQRTESRMEELASAQKETQQEMQTLAKRLGDLGATVGGIGNSMGYALENEAYRMLPGVLKKKYGLEMTERFVRTYVGGEEINIFGKARQNGEEWLVVGETKSRLNERPGKSDVWQQLSKKIAVVKQAHPDAKIKPLIITHFARPSVLKYAEEQGIIVVQSFEW